MQSPLNNIQLDPSVDMGYQPTETRRLETVVREIELGSIYTISRFDGSSFETIGFFSTLERAQDILYAEVNTISVGGSFSLLVIRHVSEGLMSGYKKLWCYRVDGQLGNAQNPLCLKFLGNELPI